MRTQMNHRPDGLIEIRGEMPRDAQGIIVRECGVDHRADRATLLQVDHDRLPYELVDAASHEAWHSGIFGIEEWAAKTTNAEFIAFGEHVLEAKLSGFRVIRHTNVSDGFPVYHFEGLAANDSLPRRW